MTLVQVLVCLLFPAVALWLSDKHKIFDLMGPVLMCYFVGMFLGNVPLWQIDEKTSKLLTEATIPLAIPLLLFSADFKSWFKHSRQAVLSFALCVISVAVASMVTGKVMGHTLPDSPHVAAMLAGTYTGGTPNLLSVGAAINADKNTIVLLNIADVIVSGMYLLLVMSIAKPLLKRFYPAYTHRQPEPQAQPPAEAPPTKKQLIVDGLKALALSIGAVAISVGLSELVFGKKAVAPIIFGITTVGILGSLVKPVQKLHGSYGLGNYLIFIFCVAIGTLTDFSMLADASQNIVLFSLMLLSLSVTLHYLLAAIFRIDIDTLIITSTASIMGPAFVGLVTESIQNRQVLLSGLTTGLVGYAVGNYLGLLIAYLLA